MLGRALIVWVALVPIAVANGALGEVAFAPRMSQTVAHALSSVTLSMAILILTRLTIAWMKPAATADAWKIGLLWLALTVAFEFLAGHYLFGTPWAELQANYDVFAGQLWILVLMTTLMAPVVIGRVSRPA